MSSTFASGSELAPLAQRTWTAGPKQALLLHGSSSSGGSWWQIGAALAERGWSATALDLPGHGASPALGSELRPAAIAAQIVASLPPEPIELLVGHSLGALVALEAATRAPGRFHRIVLEEPPGPLSLDLETMARGLEDRAREVRENPGSKLNAIREAFPRWHEADCWQAAYDLFCCDDSYAAAGLRRGSDWAPVQLAAAVKTPALVLLAPDADGVYDDTVDGTALRRSERQAFLDSLYKGQARVLDTGHCIHRDDPQGWLAAVDAFLDGVR